MKNMNKCQKFLYLTAMIIMAIIIFIALMWGITLISGNIRADVTKLQKHSLQTISKQIAEEIATPVNITFYISDDLDSEYPELGIHKQNIVRLLGKYQSYSKGKISINIKNPEPYSPTEHEAKNVGIRPFADTQNTHNMYFGAVFSNGDGKRFTIPYFSVQRENYLEYDISRILAKLNEKEMPKVGVISFAGDISNWQIFKKIEADYPLIFLSNKTPEIPLSVKTLIVFNPQQVNNNIVYALDQFVMRGGNLILLIDPYAEAVAEKYPYTKNNKNKLLPLIKKWGVDMDENAIIADTHLSQEEYQTALSPKDNPTYLTLSAENMETSEIMPKTWSRLNLRSSGALNIIPQSEMQYIPLLTTSKNAGLIDANIVKHSDIETIYNNLPAKKQTYHPAYWLKGKTTSLFEESIVAGSQLEKEFAPFIPSSLKESNIIIIADSDFLSDATWNATGYQKEATVYDQIPSANNGDFILSMIDYLSQKGKLAQIQATYLINDESNIAEQIYKQVFKLHANDYKQTEQKIAALQKDLSEFQQNLTRGEVGMSLLKIQELDKYNRQYQRLTEELKALNFKIQQQSSQILNQIIWQNMILFPMLILLLVFLVVKIYKYRRKQRIIRIINE